MIQYAGDDRDLGNAVLRQDQFIFDAVKGVLKRRNDQVIGARAL